MQSSACWVRIYIYIYIVDVWLITDPWTFPSPRFVTISTEPGSLVPSTHLHFGLHQRDDRLQPMDFHQWIFLREKCRKPRKSMQIYDDIWWYMHIHNINRINMYISWVLITYCTGYLGIAWQWWCLMGGNPLVFFNGSYRKSPFSIGKPW